MKKTLYVSSHAQKRMRERVVTLEEIHHVLIDPRSTCYSTYEGRCVVYGRPYGIRLVIDMSAGVLVTVTETEARRRCYKGRRLSRNMRVHYPPPQGSDPYQRRDAWIWMRGRNPVD